ncbi:hypothetical protein F4678DRAFT_424067 [Xylaria arbuscula]|nr:hypothetical protein F4678DRAFT_424067 [Xylaria arbuscula]
MIGTILVVVTAHTTWFVTWLWPVLSSTRIVLDQVHTLHYPGIYTNHNPNHLSLARDANPYRKGVGTESIVGESTGIIR